MKIEDYTRAHKSVAIYNASKRYGRVSAVGSEAIDLLHRMSTNDLLPLLDNPGVGAQTVLTNEKGRIIDLLTVLSRGKDALLVTSGGSEESDIRWLDKFVIMEDAKFLNASEEISQFLIFGPDALAIVQEYSETSLVGLENFHSVEIRIGEVSVTLQKTHRVIESGWAIFVERSREAEVWQTLRSRIELAGGTSIDDELYDVLRIEAGIPLSPAELNDKHNPLETTLVQAISWTKGCYIGQEVIARLDSYDKVQRHLLGVEMGAELSSQVMPSTVMNTDGEAIGELTSVAYSPSLGKQIGLAFIKTAHAIPKMSVQIGDEKLAAQLVKLPFEM